MVSRSRFTTGGFDRDTLAYEVVTSSKKPLDLTRWTHSDLAYGIIAV